MNFSPTDYMLYITLKRQYRKCLHNHLFTYSVPKEEQY